MHDFLTIGSSTVDIAIHTKRLRHSGRHGKDELVCLPFASKTDVERLRLLPGGSAANSAVTLAQLGEKTAVLSAVGHDALGDIVLKDLRHHHVDISAMKRLPDTTAVGIDIIANNGEKSVLVYRGASALLSGKHATAAMITNSKRLFITALVSDSNYSLFKKALRLAHAYRKPIVFAPSITMLREHAAKLCFVPCDVIIMNDEEGRYLTGKRSIKDILHALPGKIKVITAGADGAYATDGSTHLHVKAPKIKVLDTSGAGDCFSGAFAHSYYKHRRLGLALQEAVAAATLKIQSEGARFCHTRKDIERCLKRFLKELTPRRI